jgi:serine/threonine protein kinase
MSDLTHSTLLERYRIETLVGRGGMADVYRAYDTRRSYLVAIKVLREDLAEDGEFLRRFQSEATALSQLQHANIVRFYSFERQGHLAFIVMDFIDGSTLRRRILQANGPLPINESLQILKQVGSALQYAHAEGILHRDVKPGNVMIASDGKALLSDFGIARMMDATTVTAMMAGTPAYMSPEQFLGKPLNVTTDIYSLGVMAYEMVAGRRPFVGDSAKTPHDNQRDVLQMEHLRLSPLPPSRFTQGIPGPVEAAILKALAKKPQERFKSVSAFIEALTSPVAPRPIAPRPIAPPPVPETRPVVQPAPPPPVAEEPKASESPVVDVSPAADLLSRQKVRRRTRSVVAGVAIISTLLVVILGILSFGGVDRRGVITITTTSSPTVSTGGTFTPTASKISSSDNITIIPGITGFTDTPTNTSTTTPTSTFTASPSPTRTARLITYTPSPTKKPPTVAPPTVVPPSPEPPTDTPEPTPAPP